jgi:hypothetical protein
LQKMAAIALILQCPFLFSALLPLFQFSFFNPFFRW